MSNYRSIPKPWTWSSGVVVLIINLPRTIFPSTDVHCSDLLGGNPFILYRLNIQLISRCCAIQCSQLLNFLQTRDFDLTQLKMAYWSNRLEAQMKPDPRFDYYNKANNFVNQGNIAISTINRCLQFIKIQ